MPADQTTLLHFQDKFSARARALFSVRLAFLAIGLLALLVPAWSQSLGLRLPTAAYVYIMLIGSYMAAYLSIGRRWQKPATFVSLCIDVLVLISLCAVSGGLRSPLMPTQIVFTLFFALLFPTPLAILPPLLMLPLLAKVDQLLGVRLGGGDILLLLWYSVLNIAVVWAVVYFDGQEEASFRQVLEAQRERRRAEVAEERAKLAREIHDGLGATLSGILLQAEYLETQVGEDAPLGREIRELRAAASEGMEELRRAVQMMRDDFDLVPALEDLVAQLSSRLKMEIEFLVSGVERRLAAQVHLTVFHVVKEALVNAARHSGAKEAKVTLDFGEREVVVRISDQGQGFDPEVTKAGHYGLKNMRERAERVGASLKIESARSKGTTVELRVPAG